MKKQIFVLSLLVISFMCINLYSQAQVIPLGSKLENGSIIVLQADSGKYLSRINYGGPEGTNPIEAVEDNIEISCKFTVTVLPDNQIAMRADTGKYLSRISRGDTNPIEAAKNSIDVSCQFTVTILDNGNIALKADNGKYLSRITRGDRNPIETAKNYIDVYCQFRVIIMK